MPKQKDKVISFKADSELLGRLDELSKHFDWSRSDVIRKAIAALHVEHLEPDERYRDIKSISGELSRISSALSEHKEMIPELKEALKESDIMFIRKSTFFEEFARMFKEKIEEYQKEKGEEVENETDK